RPGGGHPRARRGRHRGGRAADARRSGLVPEDPPRLWPPRPPLRVHQLLRGSGSAAQAGDVQAVGSRPDRGRSQREPRDGRATPARPALLAAAGYRPKQLTPKLPHQRKGSVQERGWDEGSGRVMPHRAATRVTPAVPPARSLDAAPQEQRWHREDNHHQESDADPAVGIGAEPRHSALVNKERDQYRTGPEQRSPTHGPPSSPPGVRWEPRLHRRGG